MSDNVVNIHPPTIEENILKALNAAKNTDELYVLRSYYDSDGVRHLEWFTTASESKIWSIGALHFLAHKLQMDSMGWDDPDEVDEA